MKIHRIAALFLSLVLTFSLVACGQASSTSAASRWQQSKTERSSCWPRKNEILSAKRCLGESALIHGQKRTETTISANYGDFLLSAVKRPKISSRTRSTRPWDCRCRKDSCHRGADRRSCPADGCRFQCRRIAGNLRRSSQVQCKSDLEGNLGDNSSSFRQRLYGGEFLVQITSRVEELTTWNARTRRSRQQA